MRQLSRAKICFDGGTTMVGAVYRSTMEAYSTYNDPIVVFTDRFGDSVKAYVDPKKITYISPR